MIKFVIVIILLAVILVSAKRAEKRGRGPVGLRVTDRTNLARGVGASVIEADGRRFLIGWSANGTNLIAELDGTAAGHGTAADTGVPSSRSTSPAVGAVLERVRRATVRTWEPDNTFDVHADVDGSTPDTPGLDAGSGESDQ